MSASSPCCLHAPHSSPDALGDLCRPWLNPRVRKVPLFPVSVGRPSVIPHAACPQPCPSHSLWEHLCEQTKLGDLGDQCCACLTKGQNSAEGFSGLMTAIDRAV